MNLYLTGYMGCGKTTVGKALARKLHRPFLDTDQWIEEKAGLPISHFFKKHGEPAFRALERQTIQEISALTQHVIALGGGVILDEENRHHLTASGLTVALLFPAEVLFRRLKDDRDRPLLSGLDDSSRLERIRAMLLRREPFYRMADRVLEFNRECSVHHIVLQIIEQMESASCPT